LPAPRSRYTLSLHDALPIWIGALVADFYAGPTSRFDLGNALVVDLLTGTLESVTDLTLFGGANALAIESAPGVWEIVQTGAAERSEEHTSELQSRENLVCRL